MITPSHLLIGAVVARVRSRRSGPTDAVTTESDREARAGVAGLLDRIAHRRPERRSWLWGSVAPDLPLYALSLGSAVYYPLVRGWSLGETAQHIYGDLFFNHPAWVSANNLLHSPTSLALITAATWRLRSTTLRAFLLGSALHTAIDIPVHHDDGPVLLWPFEWTYRFPSPVSYWDPAHHGRAFSTFEYALIVAMAVYLWRTRSRADDPDEAAGETGDGATATRS